jgi:hypothetical protein
MAAPSTRSLRLDKLAAPFQAALAAASTLPGLPGLTRYETARVGRLYRAADRLTPRPVAEWHRYAALVTREQIAARTRQPV